MYYNVVSFLPLTNVQFSMAIVELESSEFTRLSKSLVPVSVNKVLLGRDQNLFFEAIARDYLSPALS